MTDLGGTLGVRIIGSLNARQIGRSPRFIVTSVDESGQEGFSCVRAAAGTSRSLPASRSLRSRRTSWRIWSARRRISISPSCCSEQRRQGFCRHLAAVQGALHPDCARARGQWAAAGCRSSPSRVRAISELNDHVVRHGLPRSEGMRFVTSVAGSETLQSCEVW